MILRLALTCVLHQQAYDCQPDDKGSNVAGHDGSVRGEAVLISQFAALSVKWFAYELVHAGQINTGEGIPC